MSTLTKFKLRLSENDVVEFAAFLAPIVAAYCHRSLVEGVARMGELITVHGLSPEEASARVVADTPTPDVHQFDLGTIVLQKEDQP